MLKKGDVLQKYLDFVDCNSTSNGRKEGSHGATYYFDPKFLMLRTTNRDDPQYEYKCQHSVLFELNRTLTEEGLSPISVGTFHTWLKQHRPYISVCPQCTDYCDSCKEYQEEIARSRQIVNRLKQSGSSIESAVIKAEYFDLRSFTLSRSPTPNGICAIPSLAVNDADRRCSDGNN